MIFSVYGGKAAAGHISARVDNNFAEETVLEVHRFKGSKICQTNHNNLTV